MESKTKAPLTFCISCCVLMCCEYVTVCLANELLPDNFFICILLQTFIALFHFTAILFRCMLGVAANDSICFPHTHGIFVEAAKETDLERKLHLFKYRFCLQCCYGFLCPAFCLRCLALLISALLAVRRPRCVEL
jgi:hypothetical protein